MILRTNARQQGDGMFTAQETRLLNVLADGKPHPWPELLKAMVDDCADRGALVQALVLLRKKLKSREQYIHCIEGVNGEPSCYVHVVGAPIGPRRTSGASRI
jgi:hypothetical protein